MASTSGSSAPPTPRRRVSVMVVVATSAATAPDACPPIPSQRTKAPSSASTTYASSLWVRARPTSVAPAWTRRKAMSTGLPLHATIRRSAMSTQTLGFHLDGQICRVGCSFCYLAAREPNLAGERSGERTGERTLGPGLLADIIAELPVREIEVAVSEPARRWRSGITAVADAAERRGLHLSITTTPDVVAADPWVLDGASRVSLSLDPEKVRPAKTRVGAPIPLEPRRKPGGAGGIDFATLDRALAECARRANLEVVGLVSLVSPDLASTLS